MNCDQFYLTGDECQLHALCFLDIVFAYKGHIYLVSWSYISIFWVQPCTLKMLLLLPNPPWYILFLLLVIWLSNNILVWHGLLAKQKHEQRKGAKQQEHFSTCSFSILFTCCPVGLHASIGILTAITEENEFEMILNNILNEMGQFHTETDFSRKGYWTEKCFYIYIYICLCEPANVRVHRISPVVPELRIVKRPLFDWVGKR